MHCRVATFVHPLFNLGKGTIMKKTMYSAVAAVAFAAFAAPVCAGLSPARAICSVRLVPGTSEGLGKAGGLVVSTKERYEDCTDHSKPLQPYMLCTALPTNLACTVDSRFHYTESALLAVFSVLVDARHNLDTVDVFFEGSAGSNRGQQIRVGTD
jgi:hypothetical protein